MRTRRGSCYDGGWHLLECKAVTETRSSSPHRWSQRGMLASSNTILSESLTLKEKEATEIFRENYPELLLEKAQARLMPR